MRLPRWTAYPALALLLAMAVAAIPHRIEVESPAEAPAAGARRAARAAPAPAHPRVVVLGIDGMDPEILREAMERFPERMASFRALAAEGGIHSLATSTPPQSPVAWSNFITGLDPGGHGIFDFIHRDPVRRAPAPSTTVAEEPGAIPLWGDWQLPLGGEPESNRSGESFWGILARRGVPADVWRMPANFPVEPAEGLSFSGMMTPALDSAYGEFTLFTTDPPAERPGSGRVVQVREFDGRIDAALAGPPNAFKAGQPAARAALRFYVDRRSDAAAVDTGSGVVVLRPGEWSEFLAVRFDLLPMGMTSVPGMVRFYLRSIEPEFELYASPVNIDPRDPAMAVSAPEKASAELADRRRGGIGPYYTQGMPEDVNALKAEVLSTPEFMAQADLVYGESVRMMDYALDRWLAKPEGGLLFFYYSTIDLCSHMVWRHSDAEHPHHDAAFAAGDSSAWSQRPGSTWKDVVLDLYLHMDPVLGRVRERLPEDATLIVMSDHGFAPYRRKFNLNTWLHENGYLVLREGLDRELPRTDPAHETVAIWGRYDADPDPARTRLESVVDWSRTRAYGVGFNALYLNLAGRERDDPGTQGDESGIVQPGAEAEALLDEIAAKLEALVDPATGERPVLRCDRAADVYRGPRAAEAPDLVVGYAAGYGNSDESTQGFVPHEVLEDNLGGTFNGSHLMAPEAVPGLLLCNRPVAPGEHGLEDLTVEVLRRYGVAPVNGMRGHPVLAD